MLLNSSIVSTTTFVNSSAAYLDDDSTNVVEAVGVKTPEVVDTLADLATAVC